MTSQNECYERICQHIIALYHDPNYQWDWSGASWVDWQHVCRVHGVAPLLHRYLQDTQWLPDEQCDWFRSQYEYNRRRIEIFHDELHHVLQAFSTARLPCIPLKGALLTTHYYDDPAVRPMADMDLLVTQDDLPHAVKLMQSQGYEIASANWKHVQLMRPDNHHVVDWTCEHPDNPRGVDLHTSTRELFGGMMVVLTDQMWSHASEDTIVGQPARVLQPDMLWVHLLLHASNHIWGGVARLIQLIDIVLLSSVVEDVEKVAVIKPFGYFALAVAQKYIDNQTLDRAREIIEADVPIRLQEWARARTLVNSSWLNPLTRSMYYRNLMTLYWSQPRRMIEVARFVLESNFRPVT